MVDLRLPREHWPENDLNGAAFCSRCLRRIQRQNHCCVRCAGNNAPSIYNVSNKSYRPDRRLTSLDSAVQRVHAATKTTVNSTNSKENESKKRAIKNAAQQRSERRDIIKRASRCARERSYRARVNVGSIFGRFTFERMLQRTQLCVFALALSKHRPSRQLATTSVISLPDCRPHTLRCALSGCLRDPLNCVADQVNFDAKFVARLFGQHRAICLRSRR